MFSWLKLFLDYRHISSCWLLLVHFLAIEFAFPTLWWWIIKQNHFCVKINLHFTNPLAPMTRVNHWEQFSMRLISSHSLDVAYLFSEDPTNVIRKNIAVWKRNCLNRRLCWALRTCDPLKIHSLSLQQLCTVSYFSVDLQETLLLLQQLSAGNKCELLAIYW